MAGSKAFLMGLEHIYAAARESEDGERCAVAPAPELREQIKIAVAEAQAVQGLPSNLSVSAAEPNVYGLNDGAIFPPDSFPFGTSPSVIRSAAAERAPLRGTLRVIVVLVDFSDKAMTQTQSHFRDLFFSIGVIPTKSVREYYSEVTNGAIDIQGDVVGPLRLPQTLAAYAHGASGMGPALPNAQTMARDALLAADPAVNFDPYDNDGNGFVDAFIVIHAGPGGEVTGQSGDIWSHKWVLDGGARAVDHTKVYGYLTVPEDCKVGVCAHELGHLLFGFIDLYDTDGSSEGIGNWCLMAAGSWGGGGNTPCHPCAWCKANQGWVSVTNPTANAVLSIGDVKNTHTVYRLWKDGAGGSEYFLAENRQQTGFDASLPGGGLLIWHIDEGQSNNTNENHYRIALVQADNRRDLEQNHNRGDAGDCYPGSSNNKTFNASSSPNSKSYAGATTCVAVTSISAPGATMTADVQVKCQVVVANKAVKDIADHPKRIKDKEVKEKEVVEGKQFKDIKDVRKRVIERPKLVERPGDPGNLGNNPGNQHIGALEARITALEALVGQSGLAEASAPSVPMIGADLRPDLSLSATAEEEDVGHLQHQMQLGSAHAKRVYDTRSGG